MPSYQSRYTGAQVEEAIAKALTAPDNANIIVKNITYIATPDNVIDVIKNAQRYSTVKLSEGDYGLIQLKGIDSFPEGLTITCDPVSNGANPNVKVAGIDITGTITNSDTWLTDLTGAELSSKLTIRYITFTNSVCIRNCIIDGVTIRDCNVTNGAISVAPNRFDSIHYATPSGGRSEKWSMQVTTSKNIVIRNCKISGYDNKYSKKYGILVECCENVFIYANTLESGGVDGGCTNGIYVCGINDRAPAGGRISISNNTVKNTSGSSIYLNKLYEANIHITKNTLYDSKADPTRHILVTNCRNTLTQFCRRDADGHNIYKDTAAGTSTTMKSSGTGYKVEGSISYVKSDTYASHTSAFETHKNTFNSHVSKFDSHVTAFNDHKNAFNSHVTQFNNHVNNTTNFHGIDSNKLVLVARTINITPEDVPTSEAFSAIIANAQDNSIIELAEGVYPKLNLKGKNAFRKNITIRGERYRDSGSADILSNYEKLTTIAGVAICSNAKPYSDTANPLNMHSGISDAQMSSGLTFEHLNFSDSFSLVNSEISDLSLYDCHFLEGAYAQICANNVNNCYNEYSEWANTFVQFPIYQTRYAHNVSIRRCEFDDARTDVTSDIFDAKDSMSAIYIKTVDGAVVTGNVIHKAAYNGIQITGEKTAQRYNGTAKGNIYVTNNSVSNTGSRSIRMSKLENANILLLWNLMSNKNNIETEADAEAVKISCDLTSTLTTNYYDGKKRFETNEYDNALLNQVTTKNTAGIFLDQTKTYNSVITDLQNQINALQTQLNTLIVAASSDEFDINDPATWPADAKFVVTYDE